MARRTLTIQNEAGIHCRPSAVIIKQVEPYAGTVRVLHDGAESDCRQILSLMALGLDCGSTAELEVEGPEAEAFADELVELFARNFDFPPRAPGEPPTIGE